MTIQITKTDRKATPIGPEGHQVHLDRSWKTETGIRATCVCGTVAEPLKDAAEVIDFVKSHRAGAI